MRAIVIALVVVCVSSPAMAQPPAAQTASQTMKTMASAADVAALAAKAKSERKEGQALISQPILQLAPYAANLEYRVAVAAAAVHETEAEMFYVMDGAATMVTGGKLVDEKRTNAANLSGTGIRDSNARTPARGGSATAAAPGRRQTA